MSVMTQLSVTTVGIKFYYLVKYNPVELVDSSCKATDPGE